MQVQAIASQLPGSSLTGALTAAAPIASKSAVGSVPTGSPVQRIWPPIALGLGLGLNAVWVVFLGYGFVSLMVR